MRLGPWKTRPEDEAASKSWRAWLIPDSEGTYSFRYKRDDMLNWEILNVRITYGYWLTLAAYAGPGYRVNPMID